MTMASLRPIKISFDALAGVDGSARFSFGETCTALASVSGPISARPASEHPARAAVEVHVRPLSSVPGTTEKFLGAAFKGIIERSCLLGQYPRTLIQVVVQALSPPSNALVAAEINACSLALVNGGSIPMQGVVCAVAVGMRMDGDRIDFILDPLNESKLDGAGCIAFLFGISASSFHDELPPSKVLWTSFRAHNGSSVSLNMQELKQATELARKGAVAVWLNMKESLGAAMPAGDGDVKMET